MRQSINLPAVFIRETVIKAIRAFFDDQGFHEVMISTLNNSVPLEPNLYPFETTWRPLSNSKQLYLPISPEGSMKKILAQGIGNCYTLGKSFRNLEGTGPQHNPEFLMLEWYRQGATYHDIIADTQELIMYVKSRVDTFLNRQPTTTLVYQQKSMELSGHWPVLSLETMFREYADLEMQEIIDEKILIAKAVQKGYQTTSATWSQLFDQIYLNEVEPHLLKEPFFLIDFPTRLSPLCKVIAEKPYLAERFEVFMAGMEIGNGNTENLDTDLVRSSFEKERATRLANGLQPQPIDEAFLEAVEHLHNIGHSWAGIGLGVDRLAMIMADVDTIRAVEPFCLDT